MIMKNQLVEDKQLIKYDRVFWRGFLAHTGALLFAIVLLILVHEVGHYLAYIWKGGHYLAYIWKGYEDASIRITPFFGMTSTSQDILPEDFAFIVLGGTLLNLTLAILVAVIKGSNKSHYALPLRMYPVMVFLVEGVVILAGLFFDQTITDFSWLVELGLSQVWVGVIGLVFILIGGYLSYEIWILLGFHQYHPVIALVIVNIPYMLYFLAGYLIRQRLLSAGMEAVKSILLICMVLQLVYMAIRILLAPVLYNFLLRKRMVYQQQITKWASLFSLFLGCVAVMMSFIVLN